MMMITQKAGDGARLRHDGGREELLAHKVGDLLAEERLGHLGHVVREARGLDGVAVDRERVVHQELGVDVGRQRRVEDAVGFADVGPRLEVLLVDLLGGALEVDLGDVRHDAAPEAGLDLEDALEEGVEALLREVGLVGQVPDRADGAGASQVHGGLAHVADVHRVDAQVTAPQELHPLVEVFVHGSRNDARRCVRERERES